MRKLTPLFLILSACAMPSKQSADCLIEAATSAVFVPEAPTTLSADVSAALQAGKVAEAAAASVAAFEEKVTAIARDPQLSEEWVKVVATGGGDTRTAARTARVASDLPLQASRLRTAGMSTSDVAGVLDAASRGRLTASDTADLLSSAADAVEKSGTFADLADFLAVQIREGARGETLTKVVTDEIDARGDKVSGKVSICHRPPGNPDNSKTLELAASAVAAHLAHGDTEGACAGDETGGGKGKGGGQGAGAGQGGGGGGGGGKGKNAGQGGGKGPGGKGKGKGKASND